MKNNYLVLGLMSGTSLDGLDIALCQFNKTDNHWQYQINKASTVSYPTLLHQRIANAHTLPALDFFRLQRDFSTWIALQINNFLDKVQEKPMLIASHGHTIFHLPNERLTLQMGSGAIISAETGLPTVTDFRSTDIALGGEGAPLVPIGDKLLFSQYDACLNLGGIANISYNENDKRIAFDISLCNIPLNYLAQQLHHSYDPNGTFAQNGKLDLSLFKQMNHFPYFNLPHPKSLGREWFEENFLPLLQKSTLTPNDQLRTTCEHIAHQITRTLPPTIHNILVTGGGAKNKFLIKRIQELSSAEIIIPDNIIIDYKEALIFAFLGLLRYQKQQNVLKEVTGASKNSCSGAIYEL